MKAENVSYKNFVKSESPFLTSLKPASSMPFISLFLSFIRERLLSITLVILAYCAVRFFFASLFSASYPLTSASRFALS